MKLKYLFLFFLITTFKLSATRWYVDEGSNAGDYYTPLSIPGNNANAGTPNSPFATVNFAIGVAAPFDTICVDAGVFTEFVLVTKNIFIFGAGKNTTFFDGLNKSAGGGIGFRVFPNTRIDIRSLAIQNYNSGLQMVSSGPSDTLRCFFDSLNVNNNFGNGFNYQGQCKIRQFRIKNSELTLNNGTAISRAVFVIGPSTDSCFISNTLVSDNSFVGIDFNTPSPASTSNRYASIQTCTIVGGTAPGLALIGFSGALIKDNILRDNQFCSIEIKTCLGNGLVSGPGSFVIRTNSISLTAPSIQRRDIAAIAIINRDATSAGANGTLTTQGIALIENEISGFEVLNTNVTNPPFTAQDVTNWSAAPYSGEVPDTLFDAFGIVLEGTGHIATRNKFINCEIGIQAQQLPAFSGTFAPISDYFDANRVFPGTTASLTLQQNGYYNCKRNIRAVNLSTSIDASNSFQTVNTFTLISNKVLTLPGAPIAPFPAINPHFNALNASKPTGLIDFSPWVKNNTDAPAIGYQGDISYLIVDERSPKANTNDYVQEGHDTVNGGPILTVEISPGYYNERNKLTKTVHYIGVSSPTINVLDMQGLSDTLYVDGGFEIRDSLICNLGVIKTTTLNTILLKSNCKSDLGTINSFVHGPIRAENLSTGNFTLNLPTGYATIGNRHIKLTLNQTNSSLTTYQAEYLSSGAPTITINSPITSTWNPQSYWFIDDGGAANFTNPEIVLNYGTNDYPTATAHTVAKRVTSPSIAWQYIKDLTPTFVATTGTVNSSISQNAKFTNMGAFAIAPIEVCTKPSFTTSTSVCLGSSINPINTTTAAPTTTITNYTWSFGNGSPQIVQTGSFTAPFPVNNPTLAPYTYSTAGTYTVKLYATNDFGCRDSSAITVTVNPLPTGTVSPTGTLSICLGSSITINANTSSSYTWNATPSLSVTSSSTLLVNVPGKYFFNMVDANGCSGTSDTLRVNLINCTSYLGISKASVFVERNGTNYNVRYRIKAINYGSTTITDVSLIENLTATFPSPATFTIQNLVALYGNLTANPLFNGVSNTSLVVTPSNTINPNDSAIFQLDLIVNPGSQTKFMNSVTGTATYTGGTLTDVSTNGNNPDVNGNGIPDESVTTDIELFSELVIPDGFSPNADNTNDLFEIRGIEAYPDNELQIFNRWGNLVYSKKAYSSLDYWNGAPNSGINFPGNKVPLGTYYYILKLNASDKPKTGYLTIKY